MKTTRLLIAIALITIATAAAAQDIAAPADVAKPPADAACTASGLCTRVLTAGTGTAHPDPWDKVTVHYSGWTTDGKLFDSSVQRGQPATFPLNRVIPCWTEGLQKMKVGGKSKLVCPSVIAYGDRGSPPKIKGGAALLFEVELLSIEAPAPAPGMPGGMGNPGGDKPAGHP